MLSCLNSEKNSFLECRFIEGYKSCMTKHPNLPKKLGDPGTNIFTAMNQVAAKHDAINLAQGFPNFGCSDHLKELVTKYMHSGANQYPPMPGIPELREAITDKIEYLYGTKFNPI